MALLPLFALALRKLRANASLFASRACEYRPLLTAVLAVEGEVARRRLCRYFIRALDGDDFPHTARSRVVLLARVSSFSCHRVSPC